MVVLFNAVEDSPNFSTAASYDVVTDGNQPLKRKLGGGEKTSKRLAGKPRKKKASGKTYVGRCVAVRDSEKFTQSRTTTGALFATVNMRKMSKRGGNQILHLAEMLDGESQMVKVFCVEDMIRSNMRVGKYCHDVACGLRKLFEGRFCDKCYLDGYHSQKHKCNCPSLSYRKLLNSQACEQLWSKLDKFSFVTAFRRQYYRYFWYSYCRWRNQYVNSPFYMDDTTPLASRKRLKRHGR